MKDLFISVLAIIFIIEIGMYSPTCIKQAPKEYSKSACFRQVLA